MIGLFSDYVEVGEHLLARSLDADLGGGRMPYGVGQRFLHHPVGGVIDSRR
ncbi:hypothetical protein ACBR40_04725 [Nonomuraea sp. AD125B]|uniref:hypothetical protein n=1 Tax=Nonomuraea sp. AD125B TaxID=3242897 RepID=UPI003529C45F